MEVFGYTPEQEDYVLFVQAVMILAALLFILYKTRR
jgi:hypothetical protein